MPTPLIVFMLTLTLLELPLSLIAPKTILASECFALYRCSDKFAGGIKQYGISRVRATVS